MMSRIIRTALVAILLVIAAPATPPMQAAQPATGVCGGAICGPSADFSPDSFPTRTPIDWTAFPRSGAQRNVEPAPGGRTIYVAQDSDGDGSAGAPFGSLNAALDATVSGDVIRVADGTYSVGLDDDYEALILETPNVTLMAERIGGAILTPRDPAQHRVGIAARADDLIIDGFVLRGFGDVGIEYGNAPLPQRNLVLRHLIVEQTEEGIRAAYVGDGTRPVVDGMAIYDVWLRDITVIALQCGEGPCNNLRWEALRVEMGGGPNEDSGADAIALESGDNIVIFNVEVSGAPGDGIDLKSATGVVANVFVHDIGRNGIKLWHGGDIINALVHNTGADAAIVFEAGDFRILNTLVARHAWGDSAYAMTAAYDTPNDPGSVEIANTVFYQNSGAVWISPNLALSVQHSLLTGSANGRDLEWGDLVIGRDGAPITALDQAGANNLDAVDPLFRDPDSGDYSVLPDSPLIDVGTGALPLPAFDLYGLPRVAGGAVDIGPVEWHAP